jgi:Ca2+-binding EF-hand superfamily protein
MSLYGVALDIEVKRILTQFKILLQKKNGANVRSLEQIFHKYDKNGNKKLDKEEFTNALADFGYVKLLTYSLDFSLRSLKFKHC